MWKCLHPYQEETRFTEAEFSFSSKKGYLPTGITYTRKTNAPQLCQADRQTCCPLGLGPQNRLCTLRLEAFKKDQVANEARIEAKQQHRQRKDEFRFLSTSDPKRTDITRYGYWNRIFPLLYLALLAVFIAFARSARGTALELRFRRKGGKAKRRLIKPLPAHNNGTASSSRGKGSVFTTGWVSMRMEWVAEREESRRYRFCVITTKRRGTGFYRIAWRNVRKTTKIPNRGNKKNIKKTKSINTTALDNFSISYIPYDESKLKS